MTLAFLHTAESHVATFDGLLDGLRPGLARRHRVEPEWLAWARAEGLTPALVAEVKRALEPVPPAGCVVCTCSTLGPIADALGSPRIFRADRPLLEAAVRTGPRLLVALCLEATRASTLALLEDCAQRAGRTVEPEVLFCPEAWPRFERGDGPAFAAAIAAAVRARLAVGPPVDGVILAQVSMHAAAPQLAGLAVPVLDAPGRALRHALALLDRSPDPP